MPLLAGRMRRRDAGHGGHERFVISPQLELSSLKQKAEVTDGGESGQQLSVECRVFGFSGGEFL